MNMKNKRIPFLLTLTGLVVMAIIGGMWTIAVVRSAPKDSTLLVDFPLGQNGAPRNLIQHNGRFWFTAPGINAIGSLVVTSTVAYDFDFYPIPTANSEPYDLAANGNDIWFTERAANQLGRLDVTSGVISEYPIPTAASAPTGIDVAGNGVWFVQQAGNQLAHYRPDIDDFDEYPYPTAGAMLEDLAASADGSLIWLTSPSLSRLASFNLNTVQFSNTATTNPGFPPYTPSQVTLDAQGNPWVSTKNGVIGRYSPATVQFFRWYVVGAADSAVDGLYWLAAGSGNQLWFTESNTGFAGQLTTKADGSTLNKWRFPVSGSGLYGVVAENDGTAWLADSGAQVIWSWSPPYFESVYLPIIQN